VKSVMGASNTDQFHVGIDRIKPGRGCRKHRCISLRPVRSHKSTQKLFVILPSGSTAAKAGQCTREIGQTPPSNRGPKGGEIGPRCQSGAASTSPTIRTGVQKQSRRPGHGLPRPKQRAFAHSVSTCLRTKSPASHPRAIQAARRRAFSSSTTSRAVRRERGTSRAQRDNQQRDHERDKNAMAGNIVAHVPNQLALVCAPARLA